MHAAANRTEMRKSSMTIFISWVIYQKRWTRWEETSTNGSADNIRALQKGNDTRYCRTKKWPIVVLSDPRLL